MEASLANILLGFFSLALVAILLTDTWEGNSFLPGSRLIMQMLVCLMFVIALDIWSWCINGSKEYSTLHTVIISLYVFVLPLYNLAYLQFTDYFFYQDIQRIRRFTLWMSPLIVLHGILALSNPWTGLYYGISEAGFRQRGILFYLIYVLIALSLLASFVIVLGKRKSKESSVVRAFLIFPIFPSISGALQVPYKELAFILPTLALASTMIVLFVHRKKHRTDPLTGIGNRHALAHYFANHTNLHNDSLLAGFLLDLDNFKLVNDTRGHHEGDRVLQIFAATLEKVFRSQDLIARLGGDEFLALAHLNHPDELPILESRLNVALENLTASPENQHIQSSWGSDVYKAGEGLKKFLERLDVKMYSSKQGKTPVNNRRRYGFTQPG